MARLRDFQRPPRGGEGMPTGLRAHPPPGPPPLRRRRAPDIRTSSSLGTTSFQSVHDYCPFAFEDGGRLAPTAAEIFADRLTILVAVRGFPSLGALDSRSLRSENYFRMKEFVRRSKYAPFPSIP
jgi:hypothetical protein